MSPDQERAADARVREVFPGIFLLHLPLPMKPTIVNVYLLHGADEWALIDTGLNSSDSIATFRSALQAVGCSPDKLRKIICTHHHPDHFGTSKTYKELTGAQLYLHRAEYERALSFAPPFLLMDEPASALDPTSTTKIEELVLDLKARYTIVVVTHNMQQAARISDRTAFLMQGRLVEYDDTSRIFTRPAERLTEDYISGRFG